MMLNCIGAERGYTLMKKQYCIGCIFFKRKKLFGKGGEKNYEMKMKNFYMKNEKSFE